MVLSRYNNLNAHKRTHGRRPPSYVVRQEDTNLNFAKCTLTGCSFKAGTPSLFVNHMVTHVRQGYAVSCYCGKEPFKVVATLKSHFRRKHSSLQPFTVRDLQPLAPAHASVSSFELDMNMEDVSTPSAPASEPTSDLNIEMNVEDSTADAVSTDDFLKSFAMMLLRLQSKSFLSVTTLQFVTEAIRGISDHASDYQRKVFRDLATKYGIEDHIRNAIEDELFNNSLHDIAVGDKGIFRSDHMRKKYYREQFDLIEPVEYTLTNGVQTHKYHYVPVQKSLQTLLKDKSVQKLYNKKGESKENVLRDFEDGTVFKENEFYIECPNGIKIILYLDAFEPCDALKAARGKHKILGVYMALGNLPSYCRSQTDPIQLVMLVKDTTLKEFSYEEILAPLFEDLQSIYDTGLPVIMDDVPQMLRGCVVGISSDNLEAHTLGGFNQGFSGAEYYCRFCYARKAQRIQGHISICKERTCDNYDKDAEEADREDEPVRGVWESSVFNRMPNFHVINGLPPCLHHDVAEGFLPIDLFRALKILVKEKWFTWPYINAMVKIINKGSPVVIREIKQKKKENCGFS
ncbi:B-cell lymphoma/leukemia 11A [Frankliniella fusca]|uniref:B-cell lymphoma/leukemia 11A n=1 Tax=Frankliniella fusca TaxID=407009 RepID=A0AAE1LTV3_9NEOP|nr:B-cell lymphoma/leukemia 11A [Frankliniella fusca]